MNRKLRVSAVLLLLTLLAIMISVPIEASTLSFLSTINHQLSIEHKHKRGPVLLVSVEILYRH